jgi:hypothetical protein
VIVGFEPKRASMDCCSQDFTRHSGIYTRAGEGLELKKFFVLAFGNIFETGSWSTFFVCRPAAHPCPCPAGVQRGSDHRRVGWTAAASSWRSR